MLLNVVVEANGLSTEEVINLINDYTPMVVIRVEEATE